MMTRCAAGVIAAGLAFLAFANADDLPVHVLNLARVQHFIGNELKHLPDYTCTETIDRYVGQGDKPLKLDDRLRVNVAVAHGRELYAWPGQDLEERSIVQMVGHGFVSDGDFSTMLHNVFSVGGAQISWAGSESLEGRSLSRYDFRIPSMRSGWKLVAPARVGTMAAAGSFWIDAASLALVRMRFAAEDMPPWSSWVSLEEDVQYAPTEIGGSTVLLPSSAWITGTEFSSHKVANRVAFTDCRKYSADSTISFDEEKPARQNVAPRP